MAKALIFDSGVGGFSIFQHIRQSIPGLSSCYLMDNQLFPYGIQPDDVLTERIVSLCLQACQQHDIQIVVIACNTASTLALPALREVLSIPVIGVVPAIKTAASLSNSRDIALLATPATINRRYIDDLISEHGQGCNITRIGSSELVELAEDHWFNDDLDTTALENILAPYLANSTIDQLVLGCTHFPLLSEQIAQLYPEINLVDSGEAIARRISFILQQQGYDLAALNNTKTHHQLLTSAPIVNKHAFLPACQRIAPFESFNII